MAVKNYISPDNLAKFKELQDAENDGKFVKSVNNITPVSGNVTLTYSDVGAAQASHNQASSTINAMTGYSKASSASAIAATDSLNTAIGKLEKALDGKQASGSYAASSHTHPSSQVNAMTGYAKATTGTTTVIATTDTLNQAIGKLELALDGKQASGNYVTTARTINSKALSSNITLTAADVGASASTHNHDDVYLKAHPTITLTDPASTAGGTSGTALSHSGTFDVVTAVTRDANGHVTDFTTTKYKLPASSNTDSKASTSNSTGTKLYLLGATKQDSTGQTTYTNSGIFMDTNNNLNAPTATAGTSSTVVATTAFVADAVATACNNVLSAGDAMVFKGTLGTSGTVTALPATHEVGWTYKVITAGTYAGQTCEVGDMIICITDGTTANNAHWTVVQNNVSTMTGATADANGASGLVPAPTKGNQGKFLRADGTWQAANNYTHPTTTATANTSTATATHGGTFTAIDSMTVNTTGHVTAYNTKTVTLPAQYSHPTGDGNLHVPATGTSNNGKFLMAGSTAGSLSWGTPTNTTYSAGTGLSLSGTTFNHSNSITAGTAGTSSATSGSTLDVPYVTYDAQGHITAKGTHKHTITGFASSSHTHDTIPVEASESEITALFNKA